MRSATPGNDTSRAEVTNITPFGVWMLVLGAEKFLPFVTRFAWFRSASVEQICAVELPSDNHLYWSELDIDLAVESVDHPERFPLISKVAQQGAAADTASWLCPLG